jgi:hypothetical protein
MFIKYYESNGHTSARLLEAKRDGNGERYDILHCQLGRVINEKEGIFKNRERGAYKYSLEEGFRDIENPDDYIANTYGTKLELILDFGPEYVFTEALKKDGIWDVFADAAPGKTDTLMSLLLHYMLWTESRQFADDFWKSSYARIAFPGAKLKSQRISDFYVELGAESNYRRFFEMYLGHVVRRSKTSKRSIIIDSTGLQNDGQMDLTAVNVHNGLKSNEVRLIFAIDRVTGYPLYFRYVKGNILDVSSLANTIDGLRQYGIEVAHCILDAGYYSGDNIETFNDAKIPYLLRLKAGTNIYSDLVDTHVGGLDVYENRVLYGGRVLFIKCVPIDFHGGQAFAYVSIDHDAQSDERRKIYMKKPKEFKSDAERDEQIRNSGVFVLVSKTKINVDEVLPLYYSRQAVEQAFDFGKNYANLMPLRTHNEATLRGHFLVSFMATVSIMAIDKMLVSAKPKAKNKNPLNFIQARSCLRQMKCHVYDDRIVVAEPDKKSNDVLKMLKIDYVRSIAR